jgi:hypothetical protein
MSYAQGASRIHILVAFRVSSSLSWGASFSGRQATVFSVNLARVARHEPRNLEGPEEMF